ncbi:MAG: RNA polymerase sigma factor [Clostridia bacterium]|nr:RNA polymerase sigma factor [Clostridia bacterium]
MAYGVFMDIEKDALTREVIKLKSGDGKAFEAVYNLTANTAYFTAIKIVKSEQDAEDVLQESYMIVLDKIATLEKSESFMSWFNMIVANKAKEVLRKNNKYVFAENEDVSAENEKALSDYIEEDNVDFIPGVGIEQQELKEHVMAMIDALSDDKRTVVLLFYYNNLSIKQIADSLDVNENTVKSRLFHAKKELSNKIKEYEKKNGKLLGIAPIPILVWALKSASVSSSAEFIKGGTSAATLAAITAESASAGSAAASTVVGGGLTAKIIGFTAVQKAVASAVALIVVGGAVAGTTVAVKNIKTEKKELSVSETRQSIDSISTKSREDNKASFYLEESANAVEETATIAENRSENIYESEKTRSKNSSTHTNAGTGKAINDEGENISSEKTELEQISNDSYEVAETKRTNVTQAETKAKMTTVNPVSLTTARQGPTYTRPENKSTSRRSSANTTEAKSSSTIKDSSTKSTTQAAKPNTTAATKNSATLARTAEATTAVYRAPTATTRLAEATTATTRASTTAGTTRHTTTVARPAETTTTTTRATTTTTTRQAETTTTTTTTQAQKATVNISITQGGMHVGSTSVTLNAGDRFTFDDAKQAVAAKGYDTDFAEHSGDPLPITAEAGKTYNITIDVE